MPKHKSTHDFVTDVQNACINEGIAADVDAREWTTKDFDEARPASDVLPMIFGKKVADQMLKPRGRPRAEFPKERINIRLSHEVIDHFKLSGQGWQTRIDNALRQFVAQHPKS